MLHATRMPNNKIVQLNNNVSEYLFKIRGNKNKATVKDNHTHTHTIQANKMKNAERQQQKIHKRRKWDKIELKLG